MENNSSYKTNHVFFSKGEQLFVRHIVGETVSSVAEIEDFKGGCLLTFRINSLLVTEGLSQDGKTAKHVRFARESRMQYMSGLYFTYHEYQNHPLFRLAMESWNKKGHGPFKISVPGGLEYALAYDDEIVVPDYSMKGSSGWIVLKKDLPRILSVFPRLKANGIEKHLDIKWLYESFRLRGVYSFYLNFTDPDSYDYRIIYDSGSRIISRILSKEGIEVNEIQYDNGGKNFGTFRPGKRLYERYVNK